MASKLTRQQKRFLAQLEEVYYQTNEKAHTTYNGWVVIGKTSDGTEYCYCGEGKGYNGAPLCPSSIAAVVFESKSDAKAKAASMNCYVNGLGRKISMTYVSAWYYFEKLRDEQKKCIEMARDMLERYSD